MLQNELFVAELQNNPEFRHLANTGRSQPPGRARDVSGTAVQRDPNQKSIGESLSNMGGEVRRGMGRGAEGGGLER